MTASTRLDELIESVEQIWLDVAELHTLVECQGQVIAGLLKAQTVANTNNRMLLKHAERLLREKEILQRRLNG
jgi:hypothetical protein